MLRAAIRAAIENAIDSSDDRAQIVTALILLCENMWYDGQDHGKRSQA